MTKYFGEVLSEARRYLDEHSDDQPRVDGYLISLLIDAASHRRYPVNKRDVEAFSESVEGLVNEFSSMEKLVALCS